MKTERRKLDKSGNATCRRTESDYRREGVAYDWQVLSQLRLSGEFLRESCGRRTSALRRMRSRDLRPAGIGGP